MWNSILAAGLMLVVPALGRADDAQAILDKAIQATANSTLRLNRLATVVRTDRGTLYRVEGPMDVERTAYLCPPDRLKYDAMLSSGGQKQPMIIGLNGTGGWQKLSGKVDDLFPGVVASVRDGDADVWGLITLLPLTQKGVTLKALPQVDVNKKAAVGLNVSRSGHTNAQLYFDATSGLLLRVNIRMHEGPLEVGREIDLFDYKNFDGINLPTRITVSQNARKIEEWTVQDYKFPDKLDDKMFVKPK